MKNRYIKRKKRENITFVMSLKSQDPDPNLNPDPYIPRRAGSGSGSRSIQRIYGSSTLA